MPVYQYACTDCSEELEVRQSFTDDSLTTCPTCEGRLRKILSAVGVVFKGSGFYRNDSRAKSASSDSDTSSSEAKNEAKGDALEPTSSKPSDSKGSSGGDPQRSSGEAPQTSSDGGTKASPSGSNGTTKDPRPPAKSRAAG